MSKVVDLAPESTLDSEHTKAKLLFATVMVILACIAFGTVPFFVKGLTQAGVKTEYIPLYRYLVSALVFLPTLIMAFQGKSKTILWGLASGSILGVGWISYVEALKLVPVSTAGVIYMTYPIFTLLVARIWLKEIPQIKAIIACILIVIAAMMTMSDARLGSNHLWALMLSLFAPFCFGLSINILVTKLKDIAPMARVASTAIGALIGLLLIIAPQGFGGIVPASSQGLYLAIGIAVITATIPQLMYATFAPVIGSAKSAIAGSIELPTMFMVGWLAFGETINTIQWLSGILIIVAISMTPTARVKYRIPR